jgi:hypothetical protein
MSLTYRAFKSPLIVIGCTTDRQFIPTNWDGKFILVPPKADGKEKAPARIWGLLISLLRRLLVSPGANN